MRWPFKPAPTSPLEARVEALERAVRDLSTDWDSTYDKFAMLLKRWMKREKASVEPEAERPPRDLVSRLRGS